jgi:phospholipid/cholesterol/gamma-HCH transport system substrate-binding protein
MLKIRTIEILVGAFMAAGFIALFFLAMQVSNLSTTSGGSGYIITARFDNIGSLKVKSPVTMAGVRVGRVSEIKVDTATYEAVVTMTIDSQFDSIPEDTFAKIFTAGLLGEQYIGLDPGGSEEYLTGGGELYLTQSSLVLEEIVGQFLFNKAEGGDGDAAE